MMDKIDFQILEALKKDARQSYSEIAEQVHLTRVAVKSRIQRMEEQGIIRGYTVIIDSKAYKKFVSLFVELEIKPDQIDKIAEFLVSKSEVSIVSQNTGDAGLHIHVYLDDSSSVENWLEENIYCHKEVLRCNTKLLIKQYKTNSYLVK
ncbi:Lrp/AsnC family transcriptional regulator [Peptoniphilaceae bacterium SGI.137]|nr:Lrp/AsnC family transcriptional regulator [Peptoniphilaceae bacterium]